MENILVSVSFGLSSAFMAYHIAKGEKYKDCKKLFVFANTSKEREETLLFGKSLTDSLNIPIHWIEGVYPMNKGEGIGYKIVSFETAKRHGEVFEEMIKKANIPTKNGNKVGLPNSATPYCSDRLKKTPIHKFAKEYFNNENYLTAIGFRAEDMPRRITFAEISENSSKYIYPLLTDFELPLFQHEIKAEIQKLGIELFINSKRGNCDLCYKKSKSNLVDTLIEGRVDFNWWLEMEHKYNDLWYRGNASILDLVEIAKLPRSKSLFDSNEEEGCFCGT